MRMHAAETQQHERLRPQRDRGGGGHSRDQKQHNLPTAALVLNLLQLRRLPHVSRCISLSSPDCWETILKLHRRFPRLLPLLRRSVSHTKRQPDDNDIIRRDEECCALDVIAKHDGTLYLMNHPMAYGRCLTRHDVETPKGFPTMLGRIVISSLVLISIIIPADGNTGG